MNTTSSSQSAFSIAARPVGDKQNSTSTSVRTIPLLLLSLIALPLIAIALPLIAIAGPSTILDESDVSTSPTATGDWVVEGFDAARTSFNRFETTLSPENVGNLVKLWDAPVSGGFDQPVVWNGKVYIGDNDHSMHALDAATGRTLWVGPQQAQFFNTSAAVGHGLVFANAFAEPVQAYDAETGEIAWTNSFEGQVSPILQGRRLFVADFLGALSALDAETGTEIWSVEATGTIQHNQQAALLDGRIFQMRTLGGLTAYDARTGAQLWSKPDDSSGGGPAAARGTVFFRGGTDTSDDKWVVARDAATGDLIWQVPSAIGASSAAPAVAYGMVFIEFLDLFALDAETGAELWRVSGVHSAKGPSVANGVVYVSNLDGEWDAFDARNGTLLWSVTIGSGCGGVCTEARPVIANGRLYLASGGDKLVAYGLP
jgi:outer membrane protein assembly factor BamB